MELREIEESRSRTALDSAALHRGYSTFFGFVLSGGGSVLGVLSCVTQWSKGHAARWRFQRFVVTSGSLPLLKNARSLSYALHTISNV